MTTCKIEVRADLALSGRHVNGETPNAATIYEYIDIDQGWLYVADPDNSDIVKKFYIDFVKVTKLS